MPALCLLGLRRTSSHPRELLSSTLGLEIQKFSKILLDSPSLLQTRSQISSDDFCERFEQHLASSCAPNSYHPFQLWKEEILGRRDNAPLKKNTRRKEILVEVTLTSRRRNQWGSFQKRESARECRFCLARRNTFLKLFCLYILSRCDLIAHNRKIPSLASSHWVWASLNQEKLRRAQNLLVIDASWHVTWLIGSVPRIFGHPLWSLCLPAQFQPWDYERFGPLVIFAHQEVFTPWT